MNPRRIAFWLGLFALVDVALLLSPLPLPDDLLTQLLPQAVVPALALAAAAYGVKVLATARGERPERTRPATERDRGADTAVVGADLDRAFDALSDHDDTHWSAENAERVISTELHRSAVAALQDRGHDRAAAEQLVAAGSWTDDRRAAAFLGDVHLPLRTRVREWATGEPTRRQAEAAAEAVAWLADRDGAAPERAPAAAVLGGDTATVEDTAELEPEVGS